MMGSGKSTIGKKLAKKLGLQFYDSDKVIEEREGLSIVDVYDFKGQDYFKKKEAEIIEEIIQYGNIILSTGGSSLLTPNVYELLSEKTTTIWLSADMDVLHQRVARRNTRPELNCGNKQEVLDQLYASQLPLFEKSNVIIQTEDTETHYIVDSIMVKLKRFLEQQ